MPTPRTVTETLMNDNSNLKNYNEESCHFFDVLFNLLQTFV